MGDVLKGMGHNIGSFSVDLFSEALIGTPGILETPMIVNRNGVPEAYLNEIDEVIGSLHTTTASDSGFIGETWSDEIMKSLTTNSLLSAELKDIKTKTTFPSLPLSQKFSVISRLIQTRESRGADTDTFFLEIYGENVTLSF